MTILCTPPTIRLHSCGDVESLFVEPAKAVQDNYLETHDPPQSADAPLTSNQSLNVENKHHHPLTTEKRILDESDGPAPKKSKKHSDVDFNSIYRESSALAGEPSTSPTNKSVIHQKQSFSKVIVEKHGEALSPFDAHPDDLKRYAFLFITHNFHANIGI
ncbi:hypothetical protein PCASD_08973 [Puccinia coronata f. sp. avenae]|uniref:Uncharacterized protein n=1 Tax=Puccinia coronata f. sp. avenae TaxID=200324 RepID=A0A2N5UKY1_9BASI|nr:hypothetical protein PCASD_08973 [Puccinia coronata f. sp. avenae]